MSDFLDPGICRWAIQVAGFFWDKPGRFQKPGGAKARQNMPCGCIQKFIASFDLIAPSVHYRDYRAIGQEIQALIVVRLRLI